MVETMTSRLLSLDERSRHTDRLFGIHFPLQLEPAIYSFASRLSRDYTGGYWLFYALSNGGFYMAPDSEQPFAVSSENGYEGTLSADAFGITACLYAFSHLSFATRGAIRETYARHFHWLRDFVPGHPEAGEVLGAID